MNTNCAGPCTLTRKTEAGTGNPSTTFKSIIVSATAHASREAGLPGRVDCEMTYCRSCGCETTADRICPACAEALQAERAEAQSDLLRRHGVRYVEDLPVSVLEEIQVEWGRC